jgi:gliding motility-associated-like protein
LGLLAKLGIAGAALLTVGAIVFALSGGWADQTPEAITRTETAPLPSQEVATDPANETPELEPSTDDTAAKQAAPQAERTLRNANQQNTPESALPVSARNQSSSSEVSHAAASEEPQLASHAANRPSTHPAVQAETPKTSKVEQISFHTEISAFDDLEVRFMPLVDASNTVSWDFGDGQTSQQHAPDYRYEVAGEYLVTLTSVGTDGSVSQVEQRVKVFQASKVVLPNIFTPNGDGLNDVLYLHADSKNVTLLRMLVLDGQGNTVFEQLGAGAGWDGTTQQGAAAQEGNYRLIIVAQGTDGQQYNESGIVRLQR